MPTDLITGARSVVSKFPTLQRCSLVTIKDGWMIAHTTDPDINPGIKHTLPLFIGFRTFVIFFARRTVDISIRFLAPGVY